MTELATKPLTFEQTAKIGSKRITDLYRTLEAILKTAKAAKSDASQFTIFRGKYVALTGVYKRFLDEWDALYKFYVANEREKEFPLDEKYLTLADTIIYECNAIYEDRVHPLPELGQPSNPLANSTPHDISTTMHQLSTATMVRNRLPKINIPTFGGDLMEWVRFRDIFVSLVHNENSLTPTEKFHHLVGVLTGEPRRMVSAFTVSDANYPSAWQVLLQRYDNKRILASAYVERINAFTPSTSSSSDPVYLREFLKTVADSFTSLSSLNIPNEADYLKLQLALDRLDAKNRRLFEEKQIGQEFPTYESLVRFVQQRCQIMELSGPSTRHQSPTSQRGSEKPLTKPKVMAVFEQGSAGQTANQRERVKCYRCGKPHRLHQCHTFAKMAPADRRKFVQSSKLCANCLSKGHELGKCPSQYTCRQCHKRHHSLLHLEDHPKENMSQPLSDEGAASQGVYSAMHEDAPEVLLGTAQMRIKDRFGKYHQARMVIDCGSQRSFITQQLAERLQITPEPNPHRMCGFGDVPISGGETQIKCEIVPRQVNTPKLVTRAVVIHRISERMPTSTLSPKIRAELDRSRLADVDYWRPGPVDFLLGADLFPKIITSQKRAGGEMPNRLNTVFGVVIIGLVGAASARAQTSLMAARTERSEINEVMERFWRVEEPTSDLKPDPVDEAAENHFLSTHTRDAKGRYTVRLPFKGVPPEFPGARTNALRRFHSLEGKLSKNPDLKQAYDTVLRDQLERGYIALASEPGDFFLPHHAVLKESTTTKLRIVFDASARTTAGSLNDSLRTGPKLQTEIKDVLLGFRLHPYVLSADICQMYLQIVLHPEDRKYQHFFYRFDASQETQEYELRRLTFGLNCSPYLALRVIKQLLIDEGAEFHHAAQALTTDMYVDDILTGAGTLEQALILQRELIELLAKGGFELKKWGSNAKPLLDNVTDEHAGAVSLSEKEDCLAKILGLQWEPTQDALSYRIQERPMIVTKRGVMSTIARIYDPLGYLAPVVFKAKMFMQRLWGQALDWDELLPQALQDEWRTFYEELPVLKKFRVPRFLLGTRVTQVDIVGFADASNAGYAAVIYVRTINEDAEVACRLVYAKTKLAPLKQTTIPRLELCAALLLVRCITALKPFWERCKVTDTYLLSDSTTVLTWINTPATRLKTFVANRVATIQELIPAPLWRHVPTTHNAADVASRGIDPKRFMEGCREWQEPAWLRQAPHTWPIKSVPQSTEPIEGPEVKAALPLVVLSATASTWLRGLINGGSSFPRMVRVVAYVRRFVRNSRNPTSRTEGRGLNLGEISEGASSLIKAVQEHHFPKGAETPTLRALAPFCDALGILRVGGRLKHAPVSTDARHPILLPKGERLVELLVDYMHEIHLHAGPQLLCSILRQRYWIVSARRLIRTRIHKCMRCHRLRQQGFTPFMSDLPPSRYEQGRAFINVGTDFAGPFTIKESSRRKAALGKAYICLFVCFSTKAVHIEVVSRMSTAAFLACFDRFVARRGLPALMVSDNGTNYTGASREMRQVYQWWKMNDTQAAIKEHLNGREVKWDHIPPRAPHFGGLWEAAVKSCKYHLVRTVGSQALTFEELSTLASRIEAVLNSRPLYPLASTPDSYDVLTPGHFLVGAPLTARLEEDLLDVQLNRLDRWQLLQRFIQAIWKRWKLDYLNNLQQRNKWAAKEANIQIGTLVLLKEKDAPPLEWTRGRITDIIPGQDGQVRVVKVKTAHGQYTRAVTTLSPLLPSPTPTERV